MTQNMIWKYMYNLKSSILKFLFDVVKKEAISRKKKKLLSDFEESSINNFLAPSGIVIE